MNIPFYLKLSTYMEPFLWDNYLEAELLDQRVCAFLFLKDIANLSFRETVLVFIQLAMVQCFSITLSAYF